jgi:serine/threonine-protein kinase
MAPEQAAGKAVDRRADIWAFGVVLYEMLTAKTLFTGETVSHTLASVLKDEIELGSVQAPPPIRRLLTRCLTRNPKDRLRDIGEARIAIQDYLANPAAESEPKAGGADAGTAPWTKGAGYWVPRVLCGVLLLALAAAVAWNFRGSPAAAITRFPISLGEGQVFTGTNNIVVAISPDGAQIAYMANRQIYVRPMSELEARPIAGTGADDIPSHPLFAPDGKSLLFYAGRDQTLRRIPVSGGAPVTICRLGTGSLFLGATWSEEGIVYAAWGKGILRVSPNGGEPEVLIAAKSGEVLGLPQILPGGDAVLFTRAASERSVSAALWNGAEIAVQTLKTGARKTLVQAGTGGRYLPTGHLVYLLNGVLFAVPFNARRLETTGSPVGIVEGILRSGNAAQFSYSRTGAMIYLPGPVSAGGAAQTALVLVDRRGEVQPLKIPPAAYGFPRVSKDGKRVTVQVDDGKESSIWICDLAGDTAPRRLTLPGTGANRYPIWTADNQRVAFQSDREGDPGIWWQRADGSAAAERLTKPEKGVTHVPDSWSPDGQTMSFTLEKENISEVWTWSLRDKKAAVLAASPGLSLGKSAFSPDGHWVAYQLTAQPNSRLYVRPFPATAAN